LRNEIFDQAGSFDLVGALDLPDNVGVPHVIKARKER
jgi:hypothetical protein